MANHCQVFWFTYTPVSGSLLTTKQSYISRDHGSNIATEYIRPQNSGGKLHEEVEIENHKPRWPSKPPHPRSGSTSSNCVWIFLKSPFNLTFGNEKIYFFAEVCKGVSFIITNLYTPLYDNITRNSLQYDTNYKRLQYVL